MTRVALACKSEHVTTVKARYGSKIGSDLVEIAPDFEMPTPMEIDVVDWQGYDLLLVVELVAGRYRCRELRMRQRAAGQEVTGEALRSVPVARFMHEGIPMVADLPEDLAEMAKQGPTKVNLGWVAIVYRLAYAVGDPPKQAVARQFRIAPATAGRWISRARDAGYLKPAKEPGKAAV